MAVQAECQPDWQTLTIQARQGRSSFSTWQPDCYSFDVTRFDATNDDDNVTTSTFTETTITKQVAYGEGFPAAADDFDNEEEEEEDESSSSSSSSLLLLDTILDFYDMIEDYCLEDCPKQQKATECRITYKTLEYANPDTPGALFEYYIPATIEMDMPTTAGQGERMTMMTIKYNITHFTGLDCATLEEEEEEEKEQNVDFVINPLFGEVCKEWQDVFNAYEPAVSSWKQYEPDCYQFTWQWFGQLMVEPVVTRVMNGQVVEGQDFWGRSMTITDFYDLINDKCIKDCPNDGAYWCRVEYETFHIYDKAEANIISMQIPKHISVDDIAVAIDDEFSYRISDFSLTHCDSSGIDEVDETTIFCNSDPWGRIGSVSFTLTVMITVHICDQIAW